MTEEKEKIKSVGTHNGRFHADDVMATAVLKLHFPIKVVRTRDLEVLKELDIVYDVGDGEFDHHSIEKEYRENGVPYAACGLIWRRFGREIVDDRYPDLSDEQAMAIFQHIDLSIIQGIDAIDNGMRTVISLVPVMNIPTLISGFNPPWDTVITDTDPYFHKAVDVAYTVLDNALQEQASAAKAKALVSQAYAGRVRPEVLVLDQSYPWSVVLNEIDTKKEVLFVIYPRDGEYLIQTVRGSGGTFGNRKSLPKAWAGLRELELGEIIGIEDAVFCHPARFIAGARSYESIMKMADIAVNEPVETIKKGFLYNLKRMAFRKNISVRQ